MELTDEQKKLINRIATENGFSDFQLVKAPGSIKGDNFLGVLTAITLTDNEKILDIILKSAHKNEAFRKAAPVHGIYDREIYMYKRVFSAFKKFQDEYNIAHPFTCTAKMFGYCMDDTEECLVMENLKTQGYQLWDKRIPLDSEHVKAVLIEYAKFHAVSFAMKHKNPKLFSDLTDPIQKHIFDDTTFFNNEERLNGYIKAVMDNGYKAMVGDPVLTACLKRIEIKVSDIFKNMFKKEEYKLVVTHGDCWCNNFLFKYQDTKDPAILSSLRILDWQLSSLSSPVFDLSYFILANSSKTVLENYKVYLRLYYDTLSAQLRDFDCDPEEIFPYAVLEHHWETFITFGAYSSIMIFKIMYSDSDEAPDFAENSENEDFMNQIGLDIKNFGGYTERLATLLKVLDDNNLI